MAFAPTPQQQAIYDLASSPRSLMIPSYAGTGKSSTIFGLAPHLPSSRKTLALAFNKRNAEILAERLPKFITVKTMNGLGHGAIMRALRPIRVELSTRKLWSLADRLFPKPSDPREADGHFKAVGNAHAMVNHARNSGLRFEEGIDWHEVARDLWIEDNYNIDMPEALLAESVAEAYKGIIDFSDQIYFSVLYEGLYDRYDTIIIDEAQDLSPLNHQQVRKSLMPGGRLIVFGDSKQSIYVFRGASSSSMAELRKLVPEDNWDDRPLTVTFRCPKVIVQRSLPHAPGFEAAPSNPEGTFRSWGAWTWLDVKALTQGHPPAFLCRNNAPLLGLAMKFFKKKLPIDILGSDLGKWLSHFTKTLCNGVLAMPVSQVRAAIETWAEAEISTAMAHRNEGRADSVRDRRDCLFAIIDSNEATNLQGVLRLISAIFAENKVNPVATFATGHKAKGMEFHTVFHLDPHRLPSKKALEKGDPKELEQEYNLLYVLETRTMMNLVNVRTDRFVEDDELIAMKPSKEGETA